MSHRDRPRGNRDAGRLLVVAGPLLLCLGTTGCFHAESLVAHARAVADHSREEVVDLGNYMISLPRESNATTTVSVKMRVFANVAKPDVSKVTEQLEESRTSLRHQTILAIRKTPPSELADPQLLILRDRVTKVTKQILSAAPITAVGFHEFAVFEM